VHGVDGDINALAMVAIEVISNTTGIKNKTG
jgi:hypothetical protein